MRYWLTWDTVVRTSTAMLEMYRSQSVPETAWSGVNGYCCTLAASSISRARRMFRSEWAATRAASCGGSVRPSFCATDVITPIMSRTVGAGTRMPRHRERTGSMTLLGLLHTRIRRQVVECFSIVRRSAACASRVNLSASVRITTAGARNLNLSRLGAKHKTHL